MNKQQMAAAIAKKRSMRTYAVSDVIDDYIELCRQNLFHGEPVVMKNLIKLDIVTRNPRRARNPKTGKVAYFPMIKQVRCKPSKSVKHGINGVIEIEDDEE